MVLAVLVDLKLNSGTLTMFRVDPCFWQFSAGTPFSETQWNSAAVIVCLCICVILISVVDCLMCFLFSFYLWLLLSDWCIKGFCVCVVCMSIRVFQLRRSVENILLIFFKVRIETRNHNLHIVCPVQPFIVSVYRVVLLSYRVQFTVIISSTYRNCV